MNTTAKALAVARSELRIPVVLFGIGIGTLVLYLLTFVTHVGFQNDFYREALPSYRLLTHGHVLAFIRTSPAYVGSLVLRAPFALLASAFGAGSRALYFVTALPCLVAPGLLAGYVAAHRPGTAATEERRGLRPIDLVMLIPSVAIALENGHPEDVIAAAFCVLAVLLAERGAGKTAGFILAVALINKSWAVVAIPIVYAVMPADRRLASFALFLLTTAIVLVPLTAIRAASGSTAASLGATSVGIFLVPQLLWWFSKTSWIVREAHLILVVAGWLVGAVWWWLRVRKLSRPPRVAEALAVLALVFFLRAALDPWDNFYYFTPFMMTIATYEDPPGFPKLTWIYLIALTIIVPPNGPLGSMSNNAHAGVFTGFALLTIALFGWLAFRPTEQSDRRVVQAAT